MARALASAERTVVVGASVRRREDPRLLTGAGRYVADLTLPGCLHAVIVRSPYAHARLRAIDTAAARRHPGVHLVVTAAELGPVPRIPIRLGDRPELRRFLQPPLAQDRVRYVGEPVALVVADDRYAAEDAAELVAADYEPLPPVPDVEAALRPDAPLLHPEAGTNLAERLLFRRGDPEGVAATAPVRLRRRLSVQRHTGVPLETRGLLAAPDPTGRLTVWGPTKVPHFNRSVLAALLGVPESRIHFVEPDVGGGFGVRGEFYPEDLLVPWAALRLRRPVKWVEDRREHLVATNHSRQQVHEIELAADREGRILALLDRALVDMGAYLRTHGVTVPELTQALLPGPYAIPHYRSEVLCVLTTKTPTGTYRGPGRFEANVVRERLVDLLAEAVGLDPAEVRRRNFIAPTAMPYDVGTRTLGTPTVYDTGDYASALDQALEAGAYAAWRRRQAEARRAGRAVGIGLASIVEKTGLGPWEMARVEVDASGQVAVYTGITALGQGIETAYAQIAAEALGCPLEAVTVVHGDTDRVPYGRGAFASRGTAVGGVAVHLAARRVRDRLVALAADRLEAAPADLVVADGAVWVRGVPARRVTFGELVAAARPEATVPRGEAPGVEATAFFQAPKMTYPYGTHLAVVEVDRETGVVHLLDYALTYDVGRAVNPRLVEGQLVGGLAQGIGGALLEELAYDAQAQPLAVTFMDYLLPAATEMPARLSVRILEETPTPLNPLGVKGAGEGGTAGAGAAIANAVADALRPFGAEVCDLPLTPARILAALRAAEAARQGATAVGAATTEAEAPAEQATTSAKATMTVPEEGRPR
jgi:carbon-monoxide dehydrogenase large subunit